MDSDPGYVPSSGWADAYLVPLDPAANLEVGPDTMYNLAQTEGRVVELAELSDIEPIEWHVGVCNYIGHKGTLEVPDGYVAVQLEHRDICTANNVDNSAEILNPGSLNALYEERAEKYRRLADESRQA